MSGSTAIIVEDVSKAYRIGVKDQLSDTFVGATLSLLKSPIQNFRRLQRLNTFDGTLEEEDTIWALRDVSFEVPQGEVLGVIGRNGAGKSTLLKIISRITEPTAGRVTIRGRAASLLEVGTGFHPELTGRENIYMNGTILGMRKREIDRKFDEIVAFSGVEKFIYTPVKRYSWGMKVRLAFSVSAHLESDILIIDEVLSVGDVEFQRKCIQKMNDIATGGRTILFVSHNLDSVCQLCTRAILLKNGGLIESGRPTKVVESYLARMESPQTEVTLSQLRPRWVQTPVVEGIELQSNPLPGKVFVASQDALDMELVCNTGGHRLRSVVFYLRFISNDGILLFTSGTSFQSLGYPEVYGRISIHGRIPRLSLQTGSYSISLEVNVMDKRIDSLPNVAHLVVTPSHIHPSKPMDGLRKSGYFTDESVWQVRSARSASV